MFSYGSIFLICTCAWCSFDEATIFVALVILRVLLTEAIRFFISFSDGIGDYLNCPAISAMTDLMTPVALSSIFPLPSKSITSECALLIF